MAKLGGRCAVRQGVGVARIRVITVGVVQSSQKSGYILKVEPVELQMIRGGVMKEKVKDEPMAFGLCSWENGAAIC